jgi:hypothetical protein
VRGGRSLGSRGSKRPAPGIAATLDLDLDPGYPDLDPDPDPDPDLDPDLDLDLDPGDPDLDADPDPDPDLDPDLDLDLDLDPGYPDLDSDPDPDPDPDLDPDLDLDPDYPDLDPDYPDLDPDYPDYPDPDLDARPAGSGSRLFCLGQLAADLFEGVLEEAVHGRLRDTMAHRPVEGTSDRPERRPIVSLNLQLRFARAHLPRRQLRFHQREDRRPMRRFPSDLERQGRWQSCDRFFITDSTNVRPNVDRDFDAGHADAQTCGDRSCPRRGRRRRTLQQVERTALQERTDLVVRIADIAVVMHPSPIIHDANQSTTSARVTPKAFDRARGRRHGERPAQGLRHRECSSDGSRAT